MRPSIQVGKSGLTENMIEEIRRQLKRHGSVRVKFLQSAPDRKQHVQNLAEMVGGAKVVRKTGFVVVLERI